MTSSSTWTPPDVPPGQQPWPQNLPPSFGGPFSESNFSSSTGTSVRGPGRHGGQQWNGPPGLGRPDHRLPPPHARPIARPPPGLLPPWPIRPRPGPPHAGVPMVPSGSSHTVTSTASSLTPDPPGILNPHHVHPAWQNVIPPQTTPFHPRIQLPSGPYTYGQRPRLTRPDGTPINGRVATDAQDSELANGLKRVHVGSGGHREDCDDGGPPGLRSPEQASMFPDRLGIPLSKYASPYVPDWLLSLPSPETTIRCQPLPEEPPIEYATSFLSLPLLKIPHPDYRDTKSILSLPVFPAELPIPPLEEDAEGYLRHWDALLSIELASLQEAAARQKLFRIKLSKYEPPGPARPPGAPITWKVSIPGIREDSPRILVGDLLILRGLYPDLRTAARCAIEARVTGYIKRDGTVYVEAADLWVQTQVLEQHAQGGPIEWVVEFKASSEPNCVMQNAIRCLSKHQTAPQKRPRSLVQRWLFPEEDDLGHPSASPKMSKQGIQWLDTGLNREQKHAVTSIVAGNHRVPYLISGPPGTGKTKTVVEAVLQILRQHPSASVLVCAPSNPATDTLGRRLSAHLATTDMLRLQSQSRTFAEVPDDLLPYCYIENDRFACPDWKTLLKYKVVVVSCLDASILVNARLTNAELLRLEVDVLSTLRPRRQVTAACHWTHLLIDEAGQASEPETAVPITVVVPDAAQMDALPRQGEPQVVLCGDIHQLGPIVTSERARTGELDLSLLERLSSRPIYTAAKDGIGRRMRSLGLLQPITWLLNNYRSHPGILLLPSTLFYNDTLEPKAKAQLPAWPELPNPKLPVLIKGVEADEDWVEEGASFFNPAEIEEVVRTVQSLMEKMPGCQQKDIGVVSPWREQVWRLREGLRRARLGGINVGNVEAYQGGEYRIVILSCVRSRRRFLETDKALGLGFIFEPKRFNVAITRAKELLIIVGNMNCHKVDPYWQALLRTAVRHKLYVGPDLDIPVSADYVSRLESRYYPAAVEQNGSGDGVGEDAAMLTAGSVAREALRLDG